MKKTLIWFILVVCLSLHGLGQVPLAITEAELAIPFGSVDGRLILVGDYLIFLDQDELNSLRSYEKPNPGSSGTGANSRDTASDVFLGSEAKAQLTLRLDSSERATTLTEWVRLPSSVQSLVSQSEVRTGSGSDLSG